MILYGRRMQKDNFIKKKRGRFHSDIVGIRSQHGEGGGVDGYWGGPGMQENSKQRVEAVALCSQLFSLNFDTQEKRRPAKTPLNDPPLRAWDI